MVVEGTQLRMRSLRAIRTWGFFVAVAFDLPLVAWIAGASCSDTGTRAGFDDAVYLFVRQRLVAGVVVVVVGRGRSRGINLNLGVDVHR